MPSDTTHPPRAVPQIMISSTFTDLQEHRQALIATLHQNHLHANVMENDSAKLLDVIDSSLEMVRESAAYIGVIGLKYGQTPKCPRRNPDELSITELEFAEAVRLERPILLFIMGQDHPGKRGDFESDPDKLAKLDAFRERAKRMSPDAGVHRVYAEFNSLEEFKERVGPSVAACVTYGVGMSALLGGTKGEISLQPIGVETLQGLGISAGLGYLYLEPGKIS